MVVIGANAGDLHRRSDSHIDQIGYSARLADVVLNYLLTDIYVSQYTIM